MSESTVDKVKKITSDLKKDYDQNNIQKFLASNEVEFEHEGTKYRVTKPNFAQKQKTYEQKNKKYMKLLQDSVYKLEEDLKKTYLEKGVDISALEARLKLLSKEYDRASLRLGEAVEKKKPENEINLLETEVTKIDDELKELSVKKTDYLEYSIESQVVIFNYSYLIYLISEKEVKGKDLGEGNKEPSKWIKIWDTYEDKINEKDESLINTVTFHACFMIRGEV